MKWVEIISLRCATNIDTPFVNKRLKGISESDSAADTPEHRNRACVPRAHEMKADG